MFGSGGNPSGLHGDRVGRRGRCRQVRDHTTRLEECAQPLRRATAHDRRHQRRVGRLHTCLNVTCGPDGVAGAVLIRSGEVIVGEDAASARRPAARRPHDLARGPGDLGSALGITLGDYGSHLFDPGSRVGFGWRRRRRGQRSARRSEHRCRPSVAVVAAGIVGRVYLPSKPACKALTTSSANRPGWAWRMAPRPEPRMRRLTRRSFLRLGGGRADRREAGCRWRHHDHCRTR